MNIDTSNTSANTSETDAINDRAAPRWPLRSIACAVLSGGKWYDVTLVDISLGGMKVRGHWDRARPVTAVSLADAGEALTGDLLILQADPVWADPACATAALHFDIPDRAGAAKLFRFLSIHVGASQSHRQ